MGASDEKEQKLKIKKKNYLNYVSNQPGEKMIAKANCLGF